MRTLHKHYYEPEVLNGIGYLTIICQDGSKYLETASDQQLDTWGANHYHQCRYNSPDEAERQGLQLLKMSAQMRAEQAKRQPPH